MFLNKAKLLIKSDIFKKVLTLCAIILFSLLCLGYITYNRINNYVIDHGREEIYEEIKEYDSIYEEGGLDELIADITEDVEEDYFINVIRNGVLIAENHPPSWNIYNFNQIPANNNQYVSGWPKFQDEEHEYEYITHNVSSDLILQIGHVIDERSEFLKFLLNIFLISFLIIVLIVMTFALIIADRTVEPIRRLTGTIEDINNNNKYSIRVGYKSGDILYDSLVSNFNYMLDRIESLINGMKDSLDNIAHDVKTPLTRLKLSAESSLLRSERGNDSMIESLQTCIEESDRILNMFNSILEISDASYGSMQLKKKEVRLRDAINSVINIYEYILEDNNIKVTVNIDENITLRVDENKMLRAISNLVDNAIKYNRQEGAEIIFNAFKDNGTVHIEVKDSGIGIDSREFDRIFEKLYRVDKSRTKGHGLGLSYANAIIRAHNGIIKVTSQLNAGSTFSVILPV